MWNRLIISIAAAFIGMSCSAQTYNNMLKSIPSSFQDQEYGLGVSACYAGVIGNKIIIAGGANFPTPGNKKYYSTIYAAEVNDRELHWEPIGTLPHPSAYGISVTSGDSLIFMGGCNADGSNSDVYSIHIDRISGKAVLHELPSMPCCIDNANGTLYNNKVYVAGGNQDGKPSADILVFDLKGNKWSRENTTPGMPRVQPVCSCVNGRLYIFGGFYMNGKDSKVATDGYCYDIKTKEFHHIAAPTDSKGNELTLSGGVAVSYKDKIYCTGGVNKDIFLDAISGQYKLVEKSDYLNKPIEWYKFNGNLFVFDPKTEAWTLLLDSSRSLLSRAGAAIVTCKKYFYYLGGELKPGVRTPETIRINALKHTIKDGQLYVTH